MALLTTITDQSNKERLSSLNQLFLNDRVSRCFNNSSNVHTARKSRILNDFKRDKIASPQVVYQPHSIRNENQKPNRIVFAWGPNTNATVSLHPNLRSSKWQHQVDHKYRHHDNCRHASFPSLLYFSRAVKRKQGLVTGSTPFVVYFSSLQGISSCPVSSLSCRKTLKHFYILDAFHVPIHFVTDRLHANVVRLMRQTRSIRTVYRIRVQE